MTRNPNLRGLNVEEQEQVLDIYYDYLNDQADEQLMKEEME